MAAPFPPGAVDPLTGQPVTAPAPSPFIPLPVVQPANQPNVQPVPGSEQVSGTSYRPAGTLPGISADAPAPAFPIPTPGMADQGGAPSAPPFPIPTPGMSNGPALIPSTTTERTTTTQGVDKASAAGIRTAGDQANQAAQAAGDAQVQQLGAQAQLERRQSQEAYGRGVNEYFTRAGEIAVQDEILSTTAQKLQETARFKPDRTTLFQGDTGALFGLSAAISAMAGGWQMGQGLTGGKNPYLESVMRIIDDNANDQIRANSQVYEELTRRLGDAKAAKAELKGRMLGALAETIEAKARFEKADLVQQGAAGVLAQVRAEQAKTQLDVEKAVSQQVTKTVQSRTQMVPNPAATAGIDMQDAKNMARAERIGMLDSLLAEGEGLAKSGELAAHTGFVDEALDAPMRWFQSRSPGQKRVEDFKAALQLINRADWASEPNGAEIQRQLSQIGVPENDAEIPQALTRLRVILNAADPGGRFRLARRAVGDRPPAPETGRVTIVR